MRNVAPGDAGDGSASKSCRCAPREATPLGRACAPGPGSRAVGGGDRELGNYMGMCLLAALTRSVAELTAKRAVLHLEPPMANEQWRFSRSSRDAMFAPRARLSQAGLRLAPKGGAPRQRGPGWTIRKRGRRGGPFSNALGRPGAWRTSRRCARPSRASHYRRPGPRRAPPRSLPASSVALAPTRSTPSY